MSTANAPSASASTSTGTAGAAIGMDVGGTHVRAALVTRTGQILASSRQTIEARSPEAVVEQLWALRNAVGGDDATAIPVGIGIAAQIWVHDGTVAVAPNLGWRDVAFGRMLRDRFGHPVRLINDLNAITAGEAAYGAGEAASDLVCVFVGTGVGMGAVVAGRIVEGADGMATELGHVKIASIIDGRRCGCGDRGCLEAYTSGRHLPERLVEIHAQRGGAVTALVERAGREPARVTAADIEAASAAGDAIAAALWEDVGHILGRQLAAVITLFDPRVLVLGGGVLVRAPTLHACVLQQIDAHLSAAYRGRTRIRATQLGDNAGVLGAALLARAGAGDIRANDIRANDRGEEVHR